MLVQAIIPPETRRPLSYTASDNLHVIVHIGDVSRYKLAPERQLVSHLCNLPAREAYLATLLANGDRLDEAATIMGVTQAT